MARTRGSRGSRRRRRKPATDWVVTPDGWQQGDATINNGDILGWALVYPRNAQMVAIGDITADEPFEFADGLQVATRGFVEPNFGITTLRVRGQITIRADPSWWTTTATTHLNLRIDTFEYNPITMGAIVPTGYDPGARQFADDPWLWNYVLWRVDSTNGGIFTLDVDVRVKRRLPENKTLYLITSNESGSGHSVLLRNKLRTLCKFDLSGGQRK